jgi:hypothetical protein
VTTLEELADAREWPPPEHAERIAVQSDYQTLYRNRRHEILQRWNGDLLRYHGREEDLVPFPAAKIAARTLAAFLFGEDPAYRHDDDPVALAIEQLANVQDLSARLLEGAISELVQGEVYLRPAWDLTLTPWAIITAVPGRRVLPTFRHRMLVSASVATVWAPTDRGSTYWRLLEEHTAGQIRYALHRGSADRLGRPIPLDDPDAPTEASGLLTRAGEEARLAGDILVVPTPIEDAPLLTHVPLGRDGEEVHGVSLFDGLESVAIALHRLYSQEQQDAEISRKRIAVDEQHIGRDRRGSPIWDRGTDLFVLRETGGAVGADTSKPVHPIEFSDDLVSRDRIAGRFRDFLTACGIAPATLESDGLGAAPSGTSRRLAQAMTVQTTAMVGRYWTSATRRVLEQALRISESNGAEGTAGLGGMLDRSAISVTLADGFVDDPAELARIVLDLDSAEAVSLETKIGMIHPGWTEQQIGEEADAIRDRMPDAPPSPQVAPFGVVDPAEDDPLDV